jgi:CBS domain-containing protein
MPAARLYRSTRDAGDAGGGGDAPVSWTVAAVMTRDVETVSPAATYKEIVERLHERQVSALPVVDADRQVAGIVSRTCSFGRW